MILVWFGSAAPCSARRSQVFFSSWTPAKLLWQDQGLGNIRLHDKGNRLRKPCRFAAYLNFRRRRHVTLMLGCHFTASGEKFDVDFFLIGSTLRTYADIFHRGEPMLSPKGKLREDCGFSVTIKDTRVFGDLRPQIPEALRFLRAEQQELTRLARFPGVTKLLLVFPCVRSAGTCGCETFPPDLVTLAGLCRIGIRLDFYSEPTLTGDDLHDAAQHPKDEIDRSVSPIRD